MKHNDSDRNQRSGYYYVAYWRIFPVPDATVSVHTKCRDTHHSIICAETAFKRKIKESRLILHELEEHLDEFERTGNIMRCQNRYPIILKQTEDLPVLSAWQQMSVEQFGYYCGRLMERVARDHIAIAGHMMALYHDRQFDPEQADIEIAAAAFCTVRSCSRSRPVTRVIFQKHSTCFSRRNQK